MDEKKTMKYCSFWIFAILISF